MFYLYYIYNTYELGWHKGIGVMLKVFLPCFRKRKTATTTIPAHHHPPGPATVVVPPAKRTFAWWWCHLLRGHLPPTRPATYKTCYRTCYLQDLLQDLPPTRLGGWMNCWWRSNDVTEGEWTVGDVAMTSQKMNETTGGAAMTSQWMNEPLVT